MAYAVQLTLSSANRVTIGDQAQEVSISLTYQLERSDTDLMQVVEEKAAEIAKAHRKVWNTLRDEKLKEQMREAIANGATPQNTNFIGSNTQLSTEASEETVLTRSTPESSKVELADGSAPLAPASMGQLTILGVVLEQSGWSEEKSKDYMREKFECDQLLDLTAAQASQWLLELQRTARAQAQQGRASLAQNGNGESHSPT